MNRVILVGRLAKDPELKTTTTGKSVCRFTVAVDRRVKADNQPTADFISVVAWNKQAETISSYLSKGRRIALEGRIQVSSYDAKDGTKRYSTEVMLDSFDFIDSKQGAQDEMPAQLANDDDFYLMDEGETTVPF